MEVERNNWAIEVVDAIVEAAACRSGWVGQLVGGLLGWPVGLTVGRWAGGCRCCRAAGEGVAVLAWSVDLGYVLWIARRLEVLS
jgi:hypothetical protein